MTRTASFPTGTRASAALKSSTRSSTSTAAVPAVTKGVPVRAVARSKTEGSRVDLISKLEVGQVVSFTSIIPQGDEGEAVNEKLRKAAPKRGEWILHEMIQQAQLTMNGSVGKAIDRAASETGAVYNRSVTVHLLSTPWRIAITAVVTRVK